MGSFNDLSMGERIAVLRKWNGETQEDLARAMGVKRNMIKNLEYGTCAIKADMLKNLALHFAVPADFILGIDYAVDSVIDRQIEFLNRLSKTVTTQIDKFAESYYTTGNAKGG